MDKILSEQLKDLFSAVAAIMAENSEQLCAMDAAVGDGDLGLTMKRGFEAVPGAMEAAAEDDVGKKLMKAGLKMSSTVPSTMGTLMSSGLMSGGRKLLGKTEMGPKEYVEFLDGFCEGLMKRGKCVPGDRTILDALDSARKKATDALASGKNLKDVAAASLEGARAGTEATKNMIPKFGKAAIFKEKALGRQDQGAVAGTLFVQAMTDYIAEN